jgi:hypothetical protein
MTRNSYTSKIHGLERKLAAHREKELISIERRLRAPEAQPVEVSPFNEAKVRRSVRLTHNRRNNGKR